MSGRRKLGGLIAPAMKMVNEDQVVKSFKCCAREVISLQKKGTEQVSTKVCWGWRGFPSGPKVKKSPSDAGDAGSVPGQGSKIPHGATKPVCGNYEPALSRTHAPQWEALMPGLQRDCAPK